MNAPLLVVDDAHLIDAVATFDTLRLLLNFASNGPPDLSLLFVGGAELLLDLPPVSPTASQPAVFLARSPRMSRLAYVAGRLAAAGATDSPLFTQAALASLHRAAAGIPRRLNRLADLALLIAYAQELPIVDEPTVAHRRPRVQSRRRLIPTLTTRGSLEPPVQPNFASQSIRPRAWRPLKSRLSPADEIPALRGRIPAATASDDRQGYFRIWRMDPRITGRVMEDTR